MRSPRVSVRVLAIAALAASCSDRAPRLADAERPHRSANTSERTAELAKEAISVDALDATPALRQRVLAMSFREVALRLGSIEYRATARFHLARNGHDVDVTEKTEIRTGANGSSRVLQRDERDRALRESIAYEGAHYFRNGPGKLRREDTLDDRHDEIREQAFEALGTYASHFGARLGLAKRRSGTLGGRPIVRYDLALANEEERNLVGGPSASMRPRKLGGTIAFDAQTAVPLEVSLRGTLEVDGKDGGTTGTLELELELAITVVEARELRPGEFISAIQRRPVEQNPVAFLDGGTRTSTTIGGGRPRPAVEPDDDEENDSTP